MTKVEGQELVELADLVSRLQSRIADGERDADQEHRPPGRAVVSRVGSGVRD